MTAPVLLPVGALDQYGNIAVGYADSAAELPDELLLPQLADAVELLERVVSHHPDEPETDEQAASWRGHAPALAIHVMTLVAELRRRPVDALREAADRGPIDSDALVTRDRPRWQVIAAAAAELKAAAVPRPLYRRAVGLQYLAASTGGKASAPEWFGTERYHAAQAAYLGALDTKRTPKLVYPPTDLPRQRATYVETDDGQAWCWCRNTYWVDALRDADADVHFWRCGRCTLPLHAWVATSLAENVTHRFVGGELDGIEGSTDEVVADPARRNTIPHHIHSYLVSDVETGLLFADEPVFIWTPR